MATEVILPRVDMDMAEGKIAHWYVKDGDAVTKGQLLFEIETDKATMEVDATAAGTLHGIRGEVGETLPVGTVVGWILAPGEAAPEAAAASNASNEVAVAPAAANAADASPREASVSAATATAGLLRATPLARSLAREHGVDLRDVAGAGPDGRILGRDVLAALPTDAAAPPHRDAPHDLHLQWARRGAGVPLLLIHGFGADQGGWRPLWQQLPETLPVLAIDLPNHGKSALRRVESLQEIAALVVRRLDDEGIGEVHLLGHSLGGGVALALAQAAPARVKSLTLLAPAGLGPDINGGFVDALLRADDEPALKAAMQPLFHDAARLTGSFVATAFQQLQSPERREALSGMAQRLMPRGRQAENLRDVLAALKLPVQVVWGRDDQVIPARHALETPPQFGLHLLAAVGHLPQIEATPLVAALVQHQLQRAA